MYSLTVKITTQPSPVNTSVDTEVTFFCAAENATLFFWYLNDSYIKYFSAVQSDTETDDTAVPPDSFVKLCIPKEDNVHLNESRIKCIAANHDAETTSTSAESLEALLLIQGTRKDWIL